MYFIYQLCWFLFEWQKTKWANDNKGENKKGKWQKKRTSDKKFENNSVAGSIWFSPVWFAGFVSRNRMCAADEVCPRSVPVIKTRAFTLIPFKMCFRNGSLWFTVRMIIYKVYFLSISGNIRRFARLSHVMMLVIAEVYQPPKLKLTRNQAMLKRLSLLKKIKTYQTSFIQPLIVS